MGKSDQLLTLSPGNLINEINCDVVVTALKGVPVCIIATLEQRISCNQHQILIDSLMRFKEPIEKEFRREIPCVVLDDGVKLSIVTEPEKES